MVEIAADYNDVVKVANMSGRHSLDLLEEARLLGLTTVVLLDEQALSPDPFLIDYLQETELLTALQLTNKPEYLVTGIGDVLLQGVSLPNLSFIFFAGYEALGWPSDEQVVASALNYIKLPPAMVEMLGEQKGLDTIMEQVRYRMLRVHPGYPYETLTDMVRSVKERGIRVVFLKPFKNMGLVDPTEAKDPAHAAEANETLLAQALPADTVFLQWVTQIKQELHVAGFPTGKAVPLEPIQLTGVSIAYFCGSISIAALAVSAAFLPLVFDTSSRLRWVALFIGGLLSAVICVLMGVGILTDLRAREAFALLGAIVFPSLGPLWALQRWETAHTATKMATADTAIDQVESATEDNAVSMDSFEPIVEDTFVLNLEEDTEQYHPDYVRVDASDMPALSSEPMWRAGLYTLLQSSVITLVGALITNALLTDSIYLSGWQAFRGVKIALIAPLLLVLAHALLWAVRQGHIRKLAAVPLRRFAFAALGSVVMGIYIWRSGNEVSNISAIEEMLRLNLENVFGARPRFKEFLIGHPATMLLGWLPAWNTPELQLGLLMLTATAQASIFNTFMHMHSPLLLGLQRTLWGLALGEVLGILLLAGACLGTWMVLRAQKGGNHV